MTSIVALILCGLLLLAFAWLFWKNNQLKKIFEENKIVTEEEIAILKNILEEIQSSTVFSDPTSTDEQDTSDEVETSIIDSFKQKTTSHTSSFVSYQPTPIYLPQNQGDIFVAAAQHPQPGSLFKALPNKNAESASFEPISINFLQFSDHFKAVSLTNDSCRTEEASSFLLVKAGTIEKKSDGTFSYWEIVEPALVQLKK